MIELVSKDNMEDKIKPRLIEHKLNMVNYVDKVINYRKKWRKKDL